MKPFRAVAASLGIACAVPLLFGSAPPAAAQSAFTSASSALAFTIKDTVTGAPESVSFSGTVQVSSKVVTDPDFGGAPTAVITVDLSGLKGVGQSTKAAYVTKAREIVQRPLAATGTLQFTFPFYRSDAGPNAARAGMASIGMTFDVNRMTMTSASAELGGL